MTEITDGPTPAHVQLRDMLKDLVVSSLHPEDVFPSEAELMATYHVSRKTVQKAIDSLVVDGLLQRVQGRGIIVARSRVESRLHLASFSEDMRRRGLIPSSRVLEINAEQPPTDIGRSLGLSGHSQAWQVDRVRLANGSPIALEHAWYPKNIFPTLDADDLTGSLYDLMRDYGYKINTAVQTLWGEVADATTAGLLACPLYTPLLVFRRIAYADGVPVENVVSRYRADRYQLHMALDLDGARDVALRPQDESKG